MQTPVNSPAPAQLTLADVAAHLGVAAPDGAAEVKINGVNTLDDAEAGDLTFLASPLFAAAASRNQAAAVLVAEELADADTNGRPRLIVTDAAAATDRALDLFAFEPTRPPVGVDATADVAENVSIGRDVRIGAGVSVGPGCVLGHGTTLHSGVSLGHNVVLGDNCELFQHVVIRERCTIGDRVIIHASAVIGTDGFGYRFDGRSHRKIAHVGRVVIENDVEIGSLTAIDRGKFAETRIGAGTKIDNLVQIGHNVRVGRLCIICGAVGIAGSTTVGDGVILAGGSGLKDHIKVGDGARVAGYTGVGGDVEAGATVMVLSTRCRRSSSSASRQP